MVHKCRHIVRYEMPGKPDEYPKQWEALYLFQSSNCIFCGAETGIDIPAEVMIVAGKTLDDPNVPFYVHRPAEE